MSSLSIRNNSIPSNVLLLRDDTIVPDGYNSNSNYNGKYLKNVPNGLTNPGNTTGSTSHQHSSAGGHGHTSNSSAHTHGVTVAESTDGPNEFGEAGGAPTRGAHENHLHNTVQSGSLSPTVTVQSGVGAHTHNSKNNDPLFRTYKLVKKNSIIGLRKRSLPFNSIILWPKTLSTIPTNFNTDNNIFTRLIKPDTTPGSNGGNSTHQHDSIGHAHTVDLASHNTHSIPTSGTPTSTFTGNAGATSISTTTHTHIASGTPTQGSSAPSNTSDNKSHTHDSISLIPASKETALIKISSLSLRKEGVPINGIVFWEDLLASIPNKFNLADGNNGTDNYLDKYPIGIPNGSTDPGTNVGSNTHQHDNQSHTHGAVDLSHTHTLSGNTQSAVGTTNVNEVISLSLISPSHTHSYNSLGSSSLAPSLQSGGGHTHNSLDNKPDSKEIALIQRI